MNLNLSLKKQRYTKIVKELITLYSQKFFEQILGISEDSDIIDVYTKLIESKDNDF